MSNTAPSRVLLTPLALISNYCQDCATKVRQDGKWWWDSELARLPPLGRFSRTIQR